MINIEEAENGCRLRAADGEQAAARRFPGRSARQARERPRQRASDGSAYRGDVSAARVHAEEERCPARAKERREEGKADRQS